MTTDELDRLEAEFVDVIARLDAQTGGNPTALFRERVVIDYELRSVARRALAAAREPLDAAWQEAEAALPEGWAIEGVVTDTGPTARPDEDYCANAGPAGEWLPFTEGCGPTPAAALRALAAALRKPVPA